MTLACRDIDDLLPALAADALPSDERLEVLEHLADCRQHDAELAGYRDVLGAVAAVLPERAPPPRLREGLLREFDRVTATGSSESRPMVRPAWRPWNLLTRPSFAYGLAATLVLLVVGLAAWNLSLQDGADVMQTSARAGDASFEVAYLPERHLAVLQVDMPAVPPGRVYQAWKINSAGQPVSLGVLPSNRGEVVFAADLSDATAVAISVEPAGGSPAPTTTPVLVGKF